MRVQQGTEDEQIDDRQCRHNDHGYLRITGQTIRGKMSQPAELSKNEQYRQWTQDVP